MKINVDTSWNEAQKQGGIGWIIRDSLGSLVGLGCSKIKRRWSIRVLEASTIKEGIEAYLAIFGDSRSRIVVEADSIEVIKALNHEEADVSESRVVYTKSSRWFR